MAGPLRGVIGRRFRTASRACPARGPASRALLLAGLLGAAGGAAAECTPWSSWECDFRDEDTQLWFQQPAYRFVADDDIDRLIADAWTAVHEYRATTKTLGDGAIRDRIGEMTERLDRTTVQVATELARTAVNDPWNLKVLYTDLLCQAFWTVINPERRCASTPEMVLDGVRLAGLVEVRAAVAELALDPFMVLGEQWGDIAGDVQRIRDEFEQLDENGERMRTLGRNLDPDALRAEVEDRFRGFEEMLANPILTRDEWVRTRTEIGATLRDTMIASAGARQEIGDAQLASDRTELDEIGGWGRDAVGRMQAMELNNMSRMQGAQAWLKIKEQAIADGNLVGLDMAAELEDDAQRRAAGYRVRRQIETVGTVLGNGVGAVLP